eukprot:s246_g6.t1
MSLGALKRIGLPGNWGFSLGKVLESAHENSGSDGGRSQDWLPKTGSRTCKCQSNNGSAVDGRHLDFKALEDLVCGGPTSRMALLHIASSRSALMHDADFLSPVAASSATLLAKLLGLLSSWRHGMDFFEFILLANVF